MAFFSLDLNVENFRIPVAYKDALMRYAKSNLTLDKFAHFSFKINRIQRLVALLAV